MNRSSHVLSRPPWAAAMAFLLAATLLPTFGVSPARALSADVVISQVYGGGGNSGATYTHDFVELFNRGTSSVSLTGWSVQYASATGTGNFGANSAQITELPAVSLAPGQYFLIQEASNAAVGSPLPTPDVIDATPIAMAAGAGKVALATTAVSLGCNGGSTPCSAAQLALIKDLVGYGNANFFEGAVAPTLSNTTAALRNTSGCTETDNNASDFTAATPSPRNTASPTHPCSVTPSLTINDVSANEGNSGATTFSFTVSLSVPAGAGGVTFDIATADDSASSPSDYTPNSLTGQTMAAGSSTYTFDVLVNGDTTTEANESFFVDVSNVVGATVVDGQGQGTIVDDDVNCGDPATLIHDVQGSGLTTPIPGTQVWIEGIVVGDFQGTGQFSGYYVQEEDAQADADPATSEGIFVFNTAVPVSVGDIVRVRGTVFEFNGLTELSPVSSVMLCSSGNALPTATTVTMPFASADFPERYEGMLVQLPQSLVISEYFNYDRFGEIVLALPLDGESRPFTGTAIDEPGAPANARTLANTLRRITLDDGLNVQNPATLRHPDGAAFALDHRFRGGDLVKNAIGVLTYGFDLYRIQPTGAADYTAVNPRPAEPEDVGGTLHVAAMNTLNFFVTADYPTGNPLDNKCGPLNNVECRGWDSDQPLEFTRQRDKLLAALSGLDADVIGLNELENSAGVEPLASIVAGLPGYAYVDTGTIGSDAIKVGLIYRPAVVTPVGSFQTLDSADDPRFIDTKSRPTLAQTFQENATGARFTVAVNHLKSKGSDCNDVGDPDLGDGQGNCSQTRRAAAEALVDWLATDPTGSGDPDFLIMGDLNSYAKEDTIDEILAGSDDTAGTSDDYTNLIAHFQGTYAYSYVFDGQAGYLDHALASASFLGQVTGAEDWHINADEPDVLDYDTSFKPDAQDALYQPNAYRSSDHDPVVVGLDLVIPTTTTLTVDPSSQQYSDKVDLTATISPAAATGSVQFQKSVDGGATFADIGSPVAVSGGEATLADIQILDPAGTSVVFDAVFDGTGVFTDSEDAAALTVTREDASVIYDPGNPVAEEVDDPGSGKWTGTLTLHIGVKERLPDDAGTGTTGIGDISNADLSVELVPLGSGGNIDLACIPGAVTGDGYDAVRPFNCSRTGEIPLGTYEVVATVTGDYYTGTYSDAFTVYDPSLGFATGGGRFVHDGDDTSFGFVMSYTKKGTNLKGSFIAVRHHDDGTVSRLKSNSLGGLAIFTSGSCGTATFNGKATYTTWDPTADGGLGAYVTTGNNSFAVRADDCNNPGTGIDAIWVGGPGAIGMISPAASNMAALTSGNILVPHGVAKK